MESLRLVPKLYKVLSYDNEWTVLLFQLHTNLFKFEIMRDKRHAGYGYGDCPYACEAAACECIRLRQNAVAEAFAKCPSELMVAGV